MPLLIKISVRREVANGIASEIAEDRRGTIRRRTLRNKRCMNEISAESTEETVGITEK